MFFSLHVVCCLRCLKCFPTRIHMESLGCTDHVVGVGGFCSPKRTAVCGKKMFPFFSGKWSLWSFAGVVMRMFQSWWVHLQVVFWQMEQSRWFNVTFWSFSWRSLKPSKGSQKHPKTSQRIARKVISSWFHEVLNDVSPRKSIWIYMNGVLLIHVSQLFMWIVWQNAGPPRKVDVSFNSILDPFKIPNPIFVSKNRTTKHNYPSPDFFNLGFFNFQANFPWKNGRNQKTLGSLWNNVSTVTTTSTAFFKTVGLPSTLRLIGGTPMTMAPEVCG